ncbi:hypothetical protein HAZT_HAZT007901 [Hyalella azteca]|uniref:Uncharacterized protein n=1 Tax=Hyalella azteca TaxID=294128 RepID=A0A6A0GY65_HYAAZ|nr:hypothetical protein HAZT_HAZT007901 [Hyalella azteca]
MNFVGNFVKSFLTTEVAPEAVVEVNIAAFANIQVLAREEGLFLYGPTKDDKYELILQQPIETNARTAIRYCNVAELDLQETPLHIAVRGQKVAVIKALMQMGVSTDAVDVKGNSVYHLAASTNKQIIEMPRSILMDAPNNAGKTPLHIACQADKPDCVTALLSAGVDVNVAATQDSCLAIHTAMAADSDTCAREILERHPNMLHVQDMKLGGTPLHWAKSKRMITALVELKCHVNAKNFDGRTALHLMTAHDRLGCVVALLSHGARPDIADKEGNTPLHLAKSVAVLHALIVFGAPLNCMNSLKETARHVIANSTFRGKAEMLYALHAVGAARCLQHHDSCCSGCSPVGSYNGVPPEAIADARERLRSPYDAFLDDAMCGLDDP